MTANAPGTHVPGAFAYMPPARWPAPLLQASLERELNVQIATARWEGLLWGGFARIVLANHVSWSVNSVCHTFGDRPSATSDQGRNNWVLGLLAFGDGWHHDHHAFLAMAFHGMIRRQFDLTALVIRLLRRPDGWLSAPVTFDPESGDIRLVSFETVRVWMEPVVTFSSAALIVVLILAAWALVFDQRTGQLTDIVMDTLKERPEVDGDDPPASTADTPARRHCGHQPADPAATPSRRHRTTV